VCGWIVTVNVRVFLVVSVFYKNKQKRKWKAKDKTRKITIPITTMATIITKTVAIIKKMKTADTGNRKENEYKLLFVSTRCFPPGLCIGNFDTQQTVTHVNY
jgi:hypothetical protein